VPARLVFSALASVDGYVEDEQGMFGWAEPDEEVHRFVNDLERPVGTYLYGRRMHETMAGWETDPALAAASPPGRRRDDLAGGREDRVLPDAPRRVDRADANRAPVRRRARAGAEGQLEARPHDRRPELPTRSVPGWSTSFSCSSRP
jgi:hypothetical protein